MPKLRDTTTGVVIEVSQDTADLLPRGYEPVTQKSTPKQASASPKAAQK